MSLRDRWAMNLPSPHAVPSSRGMLPRGTQQCLLTQSRQEIGSGDVLEYRIVVACGDEFGPAHALIDQDGIPPVSRQIDGSGQTGRSAADVSNRSFESSFGHFAANARTAPPVPGFEEPACGTSR
jgi:hypothetical protein